MSIPRRRFLRTSTRLLAAGAGLGLLQACRSAAPVPPAAAPTQATTASLAAAATRASQSVASASPAPAATGGKVSFMAWGTPQAVADRKQFCVDFDRSHPGVQCSFIYAPGKYMDKLLTMVAGGDAPDVFFANATELPIMISKSILHPLDDFIQQSKYDVSDFVPAAFHQYQHAGKTYGLPRGFGMEAIFYNIDLFKKAGVPPVPTDWKATGWDFAALAAAAQKLTTGSGAGRTFGYVIDPTNNREWMTYVWSNGGEIFNSDNSQCLLDQPPAVEALQFMQDLIVKYHAAPTAAQTTEIGFIPMFDTGHVAMSISEPFTFAERRKEAKFTWDVGIIPSGAKGRIPGGGGVGWALYNGVKDPNLAWDLLAELAGPKFQLSELKDGTTTPPRLSVLKSGAFLDTAQPPAHASIFVSEGALVRTDPQPVNWPEINTALQNQLSYLWSGEHSAPEVARAIVADVNAILKKPVS